MGAPEGTKQDFDTNKTKRQKMDLSHIRTNEGLIELGQIVLSGIGGIFCLALNGNGFWSFVYWSTCIISSLFFAMNIFKMLPALEARFPLLSKVRLGYVGIWLILYLICALLSIISFNLSGILVYVLIVLFGLDLFFRYRAYKSGGGADATASNPTATAASGGEVPKY